MKTYLMLSLFCFSSLLVFSQQLELEKASPFTAVKWEQDQPIVQFENDWYAFEQLDHLSKQVLLDFCKEEFGKKWQKRFSEDLVEVLQGLAYQPNIKVSLLLSKDGTAKEYEGTFTSENRERSLEYNRTATTVAVPQKLSKANALEDLQQFEELLNTTSSYSQLSNFDYKAAIAKVSAGVSKNEEVDINEFTHELAKIMAEIGDRHSSVKNESFNPQGHPTYNKRLPFGLATIDGKLVAMKQNVNDDHYAYYHKSHPFIKSIDGVTIETLIDSYSYRGKKAPTAAKLSRASSEIERYGALLFKNNKECPEAVTIVFTNGKTDKTETLDLTSERKGYRSKLLLAHDRRAEQAEQEHFDELIQILTYNIGYIALPEMYHYDEKVGLEAFIEEALEGFSGTKALIIDVRNNPGGGRELVQTFAKYIVQPAQSPWVANVAYLRTDSILNDDVSSMKGRYLYHYDSDKLTDLDRAAIDQFNVDFKLQRSFETSKFSGPFYMVLTPGTKSYNRPVYILVNEKSFSAATVFTSAFKGLPNVTIVGETSDGSSGNSRIMNLKHSNIRVRVSTMLSFQRNGLTLDGNGTVPDMVIPANEAQVLKGVDHQLQTLLEHINNKK